MGEDLSICEECEEIIVYDVRMPKLLANMSNQDHIVRVNHGMKMRIISRPGLYFLCSLLGDIFCKNRNGSWQEAADISGHHQNKDKLFTFA